MKAFRFRLQRVLDLRQRQMEQEEAKLQQILRSVAALRQQIATLESEGEQAALSLFSQPHVQGSDLAALAQYRERIYHTGQRLTADLAQLQATAGEQQRLYTEARRKVRLLEKLKERRLDEWEIAAQQEIDEVQADSFLARWNREARSGKR